ncbi:hypothetical protein [Streptomyces morookaense]|nr:hypothetical protein [Streptomyces morookaense]GHF37083.1 hypothetical protein GCM10010359_44650 [Streptomyces morookaense]
MAVGWRDTGSNSGTTVYACPDCALKIDPGPSPEDTQSATDPR